MLFVLIGQIGKMGQKSREYLESKGFEEVKKLTYIPENLVVAEAQFGKRTIVSKKEVMECDFYYENNGRIIGFNKDQIFDAVHGEKNCFISTSPETFEFVKQIKSAYWDCVTVIFSYIDASTLDYIFSYEYKITDEDKKARLAVGEKVKNIYIENEKYFDAVILYGGENSPFNIKELCLQYDRLIDEGKTRENRRKNFVEMPYKGSEPFIFVSYKSEDKTIVEYDLRLLQKNGYRVWYDEGIHAGANWRKIIGQKISECKCFVVFVSANAVNTENVETEVCRALDLVAEKSSGLDSVFTVRLDGAEFDDGIEMYLKRYQNIDAKKDKYIERLIEGLSDELKN